MNREVLIEQAKVWRSEAMVQSAAWTHLNNIIDKLLCAETPGEVDAHFRSYQEALVALEVLQGDEHVSAFCEKLALVSSPKKKGKAPPEPGNLIKFPIQRRLIGDKG